MQTEIIRIVETGLNGDRKKVQEYTKLLIQRLKKDGDERFAKRLERTLSLNQPALAGMASLDEISSQAPLDKESRMSMLEIENPNVVSNLILNDSIADAVSKFVNKIKNKDKLVAAGIQSNFSLLLYGPPGCGKTTIANYIAEEAGLPIITARLDTIVSSLLGSTSKNIRKIFEFANTKPCIFFIDEFDAIAKARDDEHEHGELKRVINSLLQSIDQFDNVLIAATNHSEILDSAIWRRFNSIIEVEKPSSTKFTETLFDSILDEYQMTIDSDGKRNELIIKILMDFTPSDIRTVLINVITTSIINDEKEIKFIEVLREIYKYKNHSKIDFNDFIKFLNKNLVTQVDISDFLNISLRKVKEILANTDNSKDGK